MNTTTLGLAAGIALGFAAAFGGFYAFVLVLLFGAIGLLVGRILGGQLDVSALIADQRNRR
ncbi:hypothetical protein [Jannaschia sp. R86511]|uniref:hypothetical protein n=1 Tax=Jannaschia sp. R86511 TaxID=3093853 RepID=UPI0036D3AF78